MLREREENENDFYWLIVPTDLNVTLHFSLSLSHSLRLLFIDTHIFKSEKSFREREKKNVFFSYAQ